MGSYPRFCPPLWERAAVICLTPERGVAAPDLPGVVWPHRRRCDETEKMRRLESASLASPAHSPCSQSHARPAGRVTTTAGGLLPHRFAPGLRSSGAQVGMLSVAVVVRPRLSPACPHLRFRGATLPVLGRAGSREVPLDSLPPSGGPPSSDGSPTDPRDIIPREQKGIKYQVADSASIAAIKSGHAGTVARWHSCTVYPMQTVCTSRRKR
jgi:hypothetical protein